MAALTTGDIVKRNNARVLSEIVSSKGYLHKGKVYSDDKIRLTNRIRLGDTEIVVDDPTSVEGAVFDYCAVARQNPPKVQTPDGEWHSITAFFKDSRFVPKTSIRGAPAIRDKAFQQRQERGLVDRINEACSLAPIRIDNIPGFVLGAEQAPDFGPHGRENLVDVVVHCQDTSWNVSCKQTEAADLGGGGMTGLTKLVPELVTRLYARACEDIVGAGLREGETYHVKDVPGFVYKIPVDVTYTIFRGSEKIGGTIDYMYIGPQTVTFIHGSLSGQFHSTQDYAAKRPYFFRLRKRDVFSNMVTVNFTKLSIQGYPVLFTTGPTQKNAARFVVDANPPANIQRREL